MACDASCVSCVGPSPNECDKCSYGEFLSISDEARRSGKCDQQSVGNIEFNLVVSNLFSVIQDGRANQERNGTLQNPFMDLRDALAKAQELSAPYSDARVTILFAKGSHFIPLEPTSARYTPSVLAAHRSFTLTIKPLPCDFAQDISSICASPDDKVTLYVKIGAYFSILLPTHTLIQKITFDFTDSLLMPDSPCASHRQLSCQLIQRPDSLLQASSLQPGCECTQPQFQAASCNFNHPVSLFNALSTSTTDVLRSLTLLSSSFQHIFTYYNSLVGFDSETGLGIQLQVQYSQFQHISLCGGSLFSTQFQSPSSPSAVAMISNMFVSPSQTAHNQSPSKKPSIQLIHNTFFQIGSALHYSSQEDVRQSLFQSGAAYEASAPILQVSHFTGPIQVVNNTFTENKLWLDMLTEFNPLNKTPSDSSLLKIKMGLLEQNLLQVQHHAHGVALEGNSFKNNSAILGLVMIDLEIQFNSGVMISHNQFSFNSALHRAVLLNIHSHYDQQQPSSCGGIHILHNTFFQNAHRPGEISQVYLACIPQSFTQTDAVDDVSADELLYQIQGIKFKAGDPLLHTYTLSSGQQVELDDRRVTLAENTFSENFRGRGHGQLITAFVMQAVDVSGLYLYRNGDLSIQRENMASFMVHRGAHPLSLESISSKPYESLARPANSEFFDQMLLFGKVGEVNLERVEVLQNWFENASSNPHFLNLVETQTNSITNLSVRRMLDSSHTALLQYTLSEHDYLFSSLVLDSPIIHKIKGALIQGTIGSISESHFSEIELAGGMISTDSSTLLLSEIRMEDVRASDLIKSLKSTKQGTIQNSLFTRSQFSMRWMTGTNLKLLNSTFSNEHISEFKYANSRILNAKQNGHIYVYNCSFLHLCGDSFCPTEIIKSSFSSNTIDINNSTFSGIRARGDHILFFTAGGRLNIYNNSYFIHNKGISGGVVRMTSNLYLNISQSYFFENVADAGGVFHFLGPGFLEISGSHFEGNRALHSGGVFVFTDNSLFSIKGSSFVRNYAFEEASVGKFEDSHQSYFQDCLIQDNESYSTFTISKSQIAFKNITYQGNVTPEGNAIHILLISSKISFSNSFFSNHNTKGSECGDSSITGGFIHDLISNQLNITSSVFQDVCAYEGGALFLNQKSVVRIEDTKFERCNAILRGGALSALNYAFWRISNSEFRNNSAGTEAAHIYLQDAQHTLIIMQSRFELNQNAITVRRSSLDMSGSELSGVPLTGERKQAIRCLDCKSVTLVKNAFIDLEVNSAVEITNQQAFPRNTELPLLLIQHNQFRRIQSARGGAALYLKWPGDLQMQNNQFEDIAALSERSEGGAVYAQLFSARASTAIQNNTFTRCSAQYGGALLWSYYEPLIQHNQFSENEARMYAPDRGSYPRSLGFIDAAIGKEMIAGLDLAREGVTKHMKLVLENVRSGSQLPSLFVAAFDKYEQIVTNVQRGTVYTTAKEKKLEEQAASTFEPLLSNLNTNEWANGVIEVTNLKLKGEPGKTYEIIFTSPKIDPALPDTLQYLEEAGQSEVMLAVEVMFRKCEAGEAFQSDGECVMCPEGRYLLEPPSAPQECKVCPEEAICYGGNQIGPKRGYWRSNFHSVNFIPCLREEGCLEALQGEEYNPQGTCAPGYFGVICSSCQTGYTRSQQFVCSMCPSKGANIAILVVVLIALIVIIVILIKCTLKYQTRQRSVFTVYLKILTSHFQLLMLVSSFDLDWPAQVEQFLNSSQSVADAPQEFFSFDCFIQTSIGRPIKRYYLYLITYFCIPIFSAAIIALYWKAKITLNARRMVRRITASLLICFFLLHPSITRVFFQAFNCTPVDGESHLVEELSEKCWQGDQLRYSLTLGLTGLVLWTLGIPAVSFWLLKRNRFALHELETQEKYGFLYKGFRQRSYYWEIVMHARKIVIAFISIFLTAQGTMVQSLFLLFVLCFFIYATLRVKPFESRHANQLELLSLIALMVTSFSGIFYLSSRQGKVGFQVGKDFILEEQNKWILFLLIMGSNGTFFFFFFMRFLANFKLVLQKKHKKCFFWLFACCSQKRYSAETRRSLLSSQNEVMIAHFDSIEESIENYRVRLLKHQRMAEREKLPQFIQNLQETIQLFQDWKDENLIPESKGKRKKQLDIKLEGATADDETTGGGSTTRRPLNTCFNVKEVSGKQSLFHRAHLNNQGHLKLPDEMLSAKIAWEEETETEKSMASEYRGNQRSYSKNTFMHPNYKISRELSTLREQSQGETSGFDLPPIVLRTVNNERDNERHISPLRKASLQFPRLSPWYKERDK